MNRLLPFLLSIPLSLACTHAAEEDSLRFKNGDVLHGTYKGLDEGPIVQWKSTEAQEPTTYSTRNLRKVTLAGGTVSKLVKGPGQVTTVSGDIFSGTLLSMGTDSVSLSTPYAGLLTFPRNQVASVLPNRASGKAIYAGPFEEAGWQVVPKASDLVEAAERAKDASKLDASVEPQVAEQVDEEEEIPDGWRYGVGAWYNKGSHPLLLETPLPEQFSIRFKLAWQNQLHVTLAVLADFQTPDLSEEKGAKVRRIPADQEEEENGEEPAVEEKPEVKLRNIRETGFGVSDADTFGSSFLLNVHNTYTRLQKMTFDEDGRVQRSPLQTASGQVQLRDLYEAQIEIRGSRSEGQLSLFVNGEFSESWQDLADPLADAERFFAIQALQNCVLRVTDVVISEWNGMPDSARSMENDERDILLLSNGTDRISGEILNMEEDMFAVRSQYAEFRIPLADVAEIHLARNKREAPREASEEDIFLHMQPHGRLTLSPHDGTGSRLSGKHAVLGDITIDLDFCHLMEFDPQGTIFDNWDHVF